MDSKLITSRSNPKIKFVRELASSRKERYSQGLYVIEGIGLSDIKSGIKELYVCLGLQIPDVRAEKIYRVSKDIFGSISDTENSRGYVGIIAFKTYCLAELSKNGSAVLFDNIQDPGNIGTMIRTAAAFGISNIICYGNCADPFSPKAVRASAGAVSNANVSIVKDCNDLKGLNIIAADLKGENVSAFNWPKDFVLAFGNEGKGISEEILKISKETVAIDIDNVESLNVAVSEGIILYMAKNLAKGGSKKSS